MHTHMQGCESHKMDKFETHASFTHIQGLLKKIMAAGPDCF